jgi:hypothetical protein
MLLIYDVKLFNFPQVGPQTNTGTLSSFTLILHGTKDRPAYLNDGPRRYNEDYNGVHKKVSGSKPYSVGLSLLWGEAGGGEERANDTASVGSRIQGTAEGNKRAALNTKKLTFCPHKVLKYLEI